jgi:hypothetical protein
VAILGRGGDRRDHLALGPRKRAWREHDPHEQFRQRRAAAVVREVASPKIDQNALIRFRRIAPQFSCRDAHGVEMLRILAEAMRVAIRKDVCAVMRGDNAVFSTSVSRQTRVPVGVQVPNLRLVGG